MKYVKVEVLKPYDYFGNFEMIDTKPCRNDAARCESDYTVLMCINKQLYSKVINNIQKNKREKEIIFLHNHFYFKNINRIYFESKMFIKYKIDNYLKGNILINQGEQLNNFIFVREGTIETSINNISLLELANKIKSLQEFIIGKAKEYDINPKDIIDFDISLNHKTSLKFELIEGILKQKQNFILSISENGSFGDYELFFDIPAILTCTVISDKCLLYFYDEGRLVLLTNGFVKKTQKTPKQEINLAKTYRADYYARKERK
jgi:CRP-like cAMP-binding protein